MSLDLVSLLPQVEMLVEATILRRTKIDAFMPNLLNEYKSFDAVDQDVLLRKLEHAGTHWPAALPSHEPVQNIYPPPPPQSEFNIFATDGSQIHPDRHASSLYFLINIGAFSLHQGSGEPPEVSKLTIIFFEDDDLYDDFGSMVTGSVINGQRDVLELESLAILAEKTESMPSLAVLDNGLLLWIAAQSGEPRSRVIDKLLHQYLKNLSRIQKSKSSLAGFIDRPRHWNVIALLALSSTPLEDVGQLSIKSNPFRGVIDRALYKQVLKPGYRSSLFLQRSKLNDEFKAAGHQVYFFYLHTGAGDDIVRVEIPEWVASSRVHLDTVHDLLLQQCKQTAGYPYALVRAHELAVVSYLDRDKMETLIQSRLVEQGIPISRSQKAETKRWTGAKRRHRL
jgi:hypothetical protein